MIKQIAKKQSFLNLSYFEICKKIEIYRKIKEKEE